MTRTIEVATTYNKKYYDICAKRMVESFVKYWPKDIKLHVYWQEQEPEIIQDNIVYHELYKVQPQLYCAVPKLHVCFQTPDEQLRFQSFLL